MNKIFFFALFILLFQSCYSPPSQENTATQVSDSATKVSLTEEIDTFPKLDFSLDYLRGRFQPSKHPDFMKVPANLTNRSRTYYLRKDATTAFEKMHNAAKEDGVELLVVSATRNFDRQKSIWEAKWTGGRLLEGREKAPEVYPIPKDRALAILRWSSMPGTSRHHWGTDMDINQLNNAYFEKGRGLKEYEWLRNHAHEYGFCQPYSPKGEARPDGYNEEKWHWSYEPVARQLTILAQTQLNDSQIDGFKGAQTATEIGVVEKFVLGVSHECKH